MNDDTNGKSQHNAERIFPHLDEEFEALYRQMQTPQCQAAMDAFSYATDEEINQSFRHERIERQD